LQQCLNQQKSIDYPLTCSRNRPWVANKTSLYIGIYIIKIFFINFWKAKTSIFKRWKIWISSRVNTLLQKCFYLLYYIYWGKNCDEFCFFKQSYNFLNLKEVQEVFNGIQQIFHHWKTCFNFMLATCRVVYWWSSLLVIYFFVSSCIFFFKMII